MRLLARWALRASACYSGRMPSGYVPILIFLVIAILFPVVLIVAARLIRPSLPSAPSWRRTNAASRRLRIRAGATRTFYIIAILFVIFDVETIFLFPWAVRYRTLGLVWGCGGGGLPGDSDRRVHLGLQEEGTGVGLMIRRSRLRRVGPLWAFATLLHADRADAASW